MKVLLLFPPHWTPTMPHLALPSLTAFLRENGVEVVQRDINIEAYDTFLSRQFLRSTLHRLRREVKSLLRKGDTFGIEGERFRVLQAWLEKGPSVARDIDTAKRIISGQDFYEPSLNISAMTTLIQGLEMASAPYYPSRLTWLSYDCIHPPDSTDGVLQAVRDREQNMFVDFYQQRVLPSIAAEAPDMVGISISTIHQVIPGLTLAHLIKEMAPSIHVTVGGKMLTCWRDVLPSNQRLFSLFDSAILHEGEHALLELVTRLDEGRSLAGVPNVMYREGSHIKVNEERYVEDVDSLPTPCFDSLPLDTYFAPERILPIAASRGCYWRRCAFCSLGYGQSLHYQQRETNKVFEDLQRLQDEYDCHHFFFVDEALSPRALREISSSLKDKGKSIKWATCTRFEQALTADLFRSLAEAGCKMLMFGLESGCERVLLLMDKGTGPEDIRRVLRESAQAGIWNHVFLFFGFPTETEEEAEETIAFFMDNLDHIHSVAAGTFILEKYARVTKSPQEFGIKRIIRRSDRDLASQYDYEAERGMSWEQAGAAAQRFSGRVTSRRQPRLYFYDVYNLLYASHHEQPHETFTERRLLGRK